MADDVMEKIVSLAKRRGFIYPGSELYGGLAGTYDYGPLGTLLKRNIERLWWRMFISSKENMYPIETAILMNEKVWEASGHVAGFSDPLIECKKCGARLRADHLNLLSGGGRISNIQRMGEFQQLLLQSPTEAIKQYPEEAQSSFWKCPNCGGTIEVSMPKQFNMMFETKVGAEGTQKSYLRPETAQGMFVNFKNIIDSFHPKLPFGIAQIGKAFRNEIAPRDFIFRVRELEIMELEYFVKESEWEKEFEFWLQESRKWFAALGFEKGDIKEVELEATDRAHYSKRTLDFHFKYPHKFDEIGGIAYRTDFDLKNHSEASGKDLSYLDPETNEKLIPHVIEPTFGLGRHVLAVIAKAYTEDELGGEKRVLLKLPPRLAPVKVAVFPLLKNKPELVQKAREVFAAIKEETGRAVVFDDNGNIGKRYRRQDEIGTPFCITIDFDTLGEKPELKDTVTIRDRDTGEQERLSIEEAIQKVKKALLYANG